MELVLFYALSLTILVHAVFLLKCSLTTLIFHIFVKANWLINIKVCIMVELKKLSLTRILKLDLRLLIEDIVETLEMFDLDALRLQATYEVLKYQADKMQVIDTPYGKHDLSDEIAKQHKKRVKYGALINMKIKALEKVDCDETEHKSKIARRLSKKHLTYLGQMKHLEVTTAIGMFFMSLTSDSCVEEREAFASLGLQPHLDELKEANAAYQALTLQRTNDTNNRPPTGDLALENETKKVLRGFFDQLSSYQKTFVDIDYEPLINTLNFTLTEYSKMIKTRLAANKRKARNKNKGKDKGKGKGK